MTSRAAEAVRRAPALARLGPEPVTIGATGGSGTRVVHAVLRAGGLFMGAPERLNGPGDAMDIEPALNAHIDPILTAAGGLDYRMDALPAPVADAARRDLARGIAAFARGAPAGTRRWGWKNPRGMFVLPAIHDLFPGMRFVHLVRDGRDMALSDNWNQPRKHHAALFGGPPPAEGDPEAAIRMWAAANLGAADWGERTLGARYLRVRFEDLCAAPAAETERLLAFAGLDGREREAARRAALAAVVPPGSLGRWRRLDRAASAGLSRVAAAALDRFGYEAAPAP